MLPGSLASLLPGLLLGGLQMATTRRQRWRYAAVAGLGLVAYAALFAAFILFGWALFLGFGTMMLPHWAAAAAGGVLILVIVLSGLIAWWVWETRPRQPFSLDAGLGQAMGIAAPLVKQHPLASVLGAAGLGAILASLLRR